MRKREKRVCVRVSAAGLRSRVDFAKKRCVLGAIGIGIAIDWEMTLFAFVAVAL